MMKIKLWGTRGSIPAPYKPQTVEERTRALFEKFFDSGHSSKADIEKYLTALPRHEFGGWGGNTPCIDARTDKAHIIIDAGSGLRELGYTLLGGPLGKGQGQVHLFFTHFHWDHLVGLPFFVPLFIPGNTIHLYAVQKDLPDMMKALFKKPYFPVSLEQLGAKIEYHILEPRKPVQMEDIKVIPYQMDHPDPCWGYRLEHGGKSTAYCVDTECTRTSRNQLGDDLPMYQNLDFMIFDSQYTLQEAIEKVNWGHAAATIGLDVAIREKIKKIAFVHHDPAASDAKISSAEDQARKYFNSQKKIAARNGDEFFEPEWSFAREGDVFEL